MARSAGSSAASPTGNRNRFERSLEERLPDRRAPEPCEGAPTANKKDHYMRTAVTLVLVAALLVPGVAGSAGEPVTFAYSQLGLLAHLPWQVALGQKYFEEQGLEPKGYNFESGAKSIAALIGGSADL